MSDLVAKLRNRQRIVKKLKLKSPNGPIEVGLVALNDQEEEKAEEQSLGHFPDISRDDIPYDAWVSERAVQILCRAIVDPDQSPPECCLKADEVREWFASSELGYLMQEYNAHQKAICPRLEDLSHEQLSNLVDEVKKKPDLLTSFDWHTLMACAHFMVTELQKLPEEKSSTTSD